MQPIRIAHFSDILCIWSYIAQIRMDELQSAFGGRVVIDYHLFPIFGDTPRKFAVQWAERGGREGYSRHVRTLVASFEHVDLHPDVWIRTAPRSSLPAHLYLAALRLAEHDGRVEPDSFVAMMRALRRAFFVNGADIAQRDVLRALFSEHRFPADMLEAYIDNGAAYAEFAHDTQLAREQGATASPTLMFNDGRQRLTGNVGYRIIEANVRELIERPEVQHSWC